MALREIFGISVSALKARLRENPCGAFAFYGPEELLKQFYLQKFYDLIEKEGIAEFNLAKLDFSKDCKISDLIGEMQILPFGGERRLIVCRGMNLTKLTDGERKSFLEALSDFPSYLILILYFENEEFESNKNAVSNKKIAALAEKISFVSFPIQEERVLLPWSQKILAKDGLRCEDRVLRILFRLCQNRMQQIRSELDKLAAYAMFRSESTVTEEAVQLLSRDTAEFAIYNLCDALLGGSVESVEKILSNLKGQDVKPIMIVAAVSKMLTNAILIAEGATASACKQATELLPWQFDRYQRNLYGVKKENLEKAMMLCVELDRKLKGYRSDPFLVTELTLIRMAGLLRSPS